MKTRFNLTWIAALAAAAVAGCSGEIGSDDVGQPTLLAVSRAKVSVGDPIEFIGQDYLSGDDGHTEIQWTGTFTTADGVDRDVNMRVHPHWGSGSRLVWANFGPFANPFTAAGDEMGSFHGEVTAVNVGADGSENESDPIPVDLDVGPSVIVRDFQPVGGACQSPAKRLLGGFPYRISVEAVGMDPQSFTFELLNEPGTDGRPRVFRQEATGKTATFGDNYEFFIAPVPDDQVFYIGDLVVTARDADGNQVSTVFSFGVHRPVEYIDWGTPEIAQIDEPEPVSGCIAGGINGQHVDYQDTQTESRSRQVSYHWDENWVQEHSGQYSTSHTDSNGVSINFNQSQEQGWSSEWSNGSSVSGSAGISINPLGFFGGSASVEVGTTHSYGQSVHGSTSTGWTVGHDYSTSDTESWAFTESESHGVTKGGGEFWEVSSSDSITKGVAGEIIPSMYGVWYRQATRISRPGSVVAYNLCGQPEVVAQAMFQDYTWAVSMAQDSECPPLPKSTLPEAQCVVAPCQGQ